MKEKCIACKENDSTGPKLIDVTGNPQNTVIRTLHMCDDCHEKYKSGEIKLNIVTDKQ